MADGVVHSDIGSQLTQAEYHNEGSHDLSGGSSFPGGPSVKDLYYRSDENKWYIYSTSWTELTHPTARDTQKNLLLTTTSETEVCAFTVDAVDRIMRVAVFFRVITATTTVTVKIYYTNVVASSVTATLVDADSLVVGDYTYAPLIFEVDASTEISLKITAGTANQVYATGTIEEIA